MQFVTDAKAFVSAIKDAKDVCLKNSPQESFNHINVANNSGDSVTVTSCSGVAQAELEVEAAISKAGSFSVRGEDLAAIAKWMKEDEVAVQADPKRGVATFSNNGNSWSLPAFVGDSFLKLRKSDELPGEFWGVGGGWFVAALEAAKRVLKDGSERSAVAQIGLIGQQVIVGAASAVRSAYYKTGEPDESEPLWFGIPGTEVVEQLISFVGNWQGDVEIYQDAKAIYIAKDDAKSVFSYLPLQSEAGGVRQALKLQPKTKPTLHLRADNKELIDAIKKATAVHGEATGCKLWSGADSGILFTENGKASSKALFSPLEVKTKGTAEVSFDFLRQGLESMELNDTQIVMSGTLLFMVSGESRAVIATMVIDDKEPEVDKPGKLREDSKQVEEAPF